MTPEQEARQRIDRRLAQCGRLVQDRTAMDLSAAGDRVAAVTDAILQRMQAGQTHVKAG